MRQIKFRGLRADGKCWVYGSYLKELYNSYIVECVDQTIQAISHTSVIPETVGQFTGLKDKNGKEIYEGDILEYYNSINRIDFQKVRFGWYYTDNDGRCHENVMGWVDEDGFPIDTEENEYTIIGNIHEKGGQNE